MGTPTEFNVNVNTMNMGMNPGMNSMKEDRNSPEYLSQLLKDKKQIQAFPNVFIHMERLLDEEINKVRGSLFHLSSGRDPLALPDAQGTMITLSEKLFVPVKEHPEFNFVGRILGPRGMTAKQLEQDTGCKIMVRGKGSMRDKKKEELNRGKPNWEHLNEELHVLITVEDTRNRSEVKLKRAVEEVKKLLVPAPEGEDDLKKRQLMELAIINGTYRDTKASIPSSTPTLTATAQQLPRMLAPHLAMPPGMRSPTPAGAPLILAPRIPTSLGNTGHHLMNGGPPPLVSHAELAASGLYPYDPYGLAAASMGSMGSVSPTLLEYTGLEHSAAGAVPKVRRAVGVREHPYTRVSLA